MGGSIEVIHLPSEVMGRRCSDGLRQAALDLE